MIIRASQFDNAQLKKSIKLFFTSALISFFCIKMYKNVHAYEYENAWINSKKLLEGISEPKKLELAFTEFNKNINLSPSSLYFKTLVAKLAIYEDLSNFSENQYSVIALEHAYALESKHYSLLLLAALRSKDERISKQQIKNLLDIEINKIPNIESSDYNKKQVYSFLYYLKGRKFLHLYQKTDNKELLNKSIKNFKISYRLIPNSLTTGIWYLRALYAQNNTHEAADILKKLKDIDSPSDDNLYLDKLKEILIKCESEALKC